MSRLAFTSPFLQPPSSVRHNIPTIDIPIQIPLDLFDDFDSIGAPFGHLDATPNPMGFTAEAFQIDFEAEKNPNPSTPRAPSFDSAPVPPPQPIQPVALPPRPSSPPHSSPSGKLRKARGLSTEAPQSPAITLRGALQLSLEAEDAQLLLEPPAELSQSVPVVQPTAHTSPGAEKNIEHFMQGVTDPAISLPDRHSIVVPDSDTVMRVGFDDYPIVPVIPQPEIIVPPLPGPQVQTHSAELHPDKVGQDPAALATQPTAANIHPDLRTRGLSFLKQLRDGTPPSPPSASYTSFLAWSQSMTKLLAVIEDLRAFKPQTTPIMDTLFASMTRDGTAVVLLADMLETPPSISDIRGTLAKAVYACRLRGFESQLDSELKGKMMPLMDPAMTAFVRTNYVKETAPQCTNCADRRVHQPLDGAPGLCYICAIAARISNDADFRKACFSEIRTPAPVSLGEPKEKKSRPANDIATSSTALSPSTHDTTADLRISYIKAAENSDEASARRDEADAVETLAAALSAPPASPSLDVGAPHGTKRKQPDTERHESFTKRRRRLAGLCQASKTRLELLERLSKTVQQRLVATELKSRRKLSSAPKKSFHCPTCFMVDQANSLDYENADALASHILHDHIAEEVLRAALDKQ